MSAYQMGTGERRALIAAAVLSVVATVAAPSISGYGFSQGATSRTETKTETKTDTRTDAASDREQPARRARELLLLGGPSSQIGVSIRDADKNGEGVVIDEVKTNGPAARAGIKTGDVIVEFDGEKVRSARQLSRLVQETPAGRTVKAAVLRQGKRTDVQIVPDHLTVESLIDHDALERQLGPARQALRDLPMTLDLEKLREQLPAMRDGLMIDTLRSTRPRLGVSLETVSGQLAGYFGVKSGVLVQSVTEQSAAARGGLKAGDVITGINNEPVNTADDLTGALRHVKDGDTVSLTVMREKKEVKLSVTPASRE